jgi:hypothetical protein
MTSDHVDMNEVLYNYVLPRHELYNTEAEIDLRAAWCTDRNEAYLEYPVNKFLTQELGPAAKPDPSVTTYGRKQRDVRKFGVGHGYYIDWLVRSPRALRDLLDNQERCFEADRETVRALILNSMFDNATGYGLWNTNFLPLEGLTSPISYGQNTFAASHNHYVTTGTTSLSTLTWLTAAKQDMREHGRNGPYDVWMNSESLKDIEDMATWITVTSVQNPIMDSVAMNGFQGHMLGCDFFTNEAIPADYLIVVDRGQRASMMAFVQVTQSLYQGLLMFSDDHGGGVPLVGKAQWNQDVYPLVNAYFLRWFNTFVEVRDAAVVVQVTDGSYSRPDVTSAFIENAYTAA